MKAHEKLHLEMVDSLWDFTNATSRVMRNAAMWASHGVPVDEINRRTCVDRLNARQSWDNALHLMNQLEREIDKMAGET